MTPHQHAATYNDILATAGAVISKLKTEGHLSERFEHSILAQLNATLHTLMFALPPGTFILQNSDNREYRECIRATDEAPKMATTKRKTKA